MSTRNLQARAIAAAVGAAALAVALTACGSSNNNSATQPPSTSAPASASTSTSASSSSSPSVAALKAISNCSGSQNSNNTFALGSFLPLTGSLSFLAPPAVAGVGAALSDINAAGGVNGKPACIVSQDSNDSDHKAQSIANVKKLISANVSAIVGPESSGVTENIQPVTDAAKMLVFSPAATDDALSGSSPLFFRDVAPNAAEGQALGNQILSDVPNAKVGILVFNDPYGLNLRDTLQQTITAGGGQVVYGAKGSGQEFPSTETNFGSIVNAAVAKQPDVIAIIAFDQTAQILPALGSAGFDGSKLYFVDGNLSDYSSTPGVPDLTGSKGTQQGVDPSAIAPKLEAWYKLNEGKSLGGIYNYGPESYDATTILALAADEAKANDPASIQKYVAKVTGSDGGTICRSYKDCLSMIQAGKSIHYEGPSSIGPINAQHDPSSAYVGIYEAQGKNTAAKFLTAIKASNIK